MSDSGPIRIEIDRLVIDTPIADREELVRAIRAELERLHAGGAPPLAADPAGGRLAVANRKVEARPGAAPREIGVQVAQTIWDAAWSATRTKESR